MTVQVPLPEGLPGSPEAAFRALCRFPHVFWLDSGPESTLHARYHHLGCHPSRWTATDGVDPFAVIRDDDSAGPAGLRPATNRIMTIAYDLGRFSDRMQAPEELELGSELVNARYSAVVTYDLADGTAWLTGDTPGDVASLEACLRTPYVGRPTPSVRSLTSDCDGDSYGARVDAIRSQIEAGNAYQVNLSQRFEARFDHRLSPPELYLALRRRPAPYGAFIDASDYAVLSNSPEGLLRLDLRDGHRTATTYPLKGTRPADVDPSDLANSTKDVAEHVMIVDLERNDLGRLAVPGTVRVPRLLDLVRHPTVLHLESEVTARVRPDLDAADVLKALFPGGSITGAPKLAAAALIAETEGRRRGLYCGAIGALDVDGRRSTWSIPIRTAIASGDTLVFRSGGGVVHDSTGEAEYAETLWKAKAFLDLCC